MSLLRDIINKWVEITEVDPNSKVFYSKNFDLYTYNNKIKSLLEYDGNELDAICLINEFLIKFLKSRSFSLYEIYYGDQKVLDKIKEINEMKSLIDTYDINSYYTEIVDMYKKALNHYGINDDKAIDILEEKENFLELKVNALKALESLEVMQFKAGSFSDNVPKYNKNIYMFTDINILLNAVMNDSTFNGITLNLIYNESHFESSYFCFVIKNGENVYIVGDIPNYSHPMFEEMSRCPGRRMAERVELFNFPYELLEISGNRYGLQSDIAGLAVSEKYTVIGTLADCNAFSIVWLINMFALIKEKFFDNHIETGKQYYTGAMLEIPGITKNETSLAIVKDYDSVIIDKMSIDDTINKKLEYSHESVGLTSWIVDRYKNQVSEELLNKISNEKHEKVSASTAVAVAGNDKLDIIGEVYTTIGTKEDFDYRHAWLNRYNLACAIDYLFKKEIEERTSELISWYRNAVENNMEMIFEAIAKGELITTEYRYNKLTEDGEKKFYNGEHVDYRDEDCFDKTCNYQRKNNMLSISLWQEVDNFYSSRRKQLFFQKDTKGLKYGWNYGCYVNNKKPVIIASIDVSGPQAIADVCGCKIEDLPDLLQHYSPVKELSYGNYIISNIDPMDWIIRNHLASLNFNIGILLSKSSYNDICKKYGIKPNKIWLNN